MATLISRASGNLTDASTWGVADTTSAQTSLTDWQSLWSGGARSSQSFTPGAITIDGVLLFAQANSGAGTVTMTLRNVTDSVNVVSVALTASLITDYTPVCFAFSAVTLIAGKAYRIDVTTTDSNNVNFGRNGTDQNFWRLLRTTTTAAPANNDVLYIQGECATSISTLTVTMDNTADLTIGAANNTTGIEIGYGGLLSYAYASSTNYQLKVLSFIGLRKGGELRIGNAAHPIPSTSTAKLIFMQTSSTQGGFSTLQGTLTTYGASKTLWTKLTSNAAASQAVINVANVTGWANGDNVAVSPHRANASDWDDKLISSISSLAVTLTTNLGAAHDGTGIPVVDACYVLNLTCNVQIYSNNSSYLWLSNGGNTPNYNCRYTRFSHMGNSGWYGGLTMTRIGSGTQTSSMDIQYCVFTGNKKCVFLDFGNVTPFPATVIFSNNVAYQTEEAVFSHATINAAAHGNFVYECRNNVAARATYHNDSTFAMPLCKGFMTGNVVLCHQDYQTAFAMSSAYTGQTSEFTFEDNICFGLNATGFYFAVGPDVSKEYAISRCKQVRSTGDFLQWNVGLNPGVLVIADCECYAARFAFYYANDYRHPRMEIVGGRFAGESSTYPISSTIFQYQGCFPMGGVFCRGVDFKSGYGIVEFFSNSYVPPLQGNFVFIDCKIPSARVDDTALGLLVARAYTWPSAGGNQSAIAFHNTDQVEDDHRWVIPYCGFGKRDNAVYNTAAPSEKLYPKSATYKMRSAVKRFPVAAGATKTIAVWVRKNTGYNGATAPRLVIVPNSGVGYKVTTALATLTTAVDTWGMLSFTLPASAWKTVVELYIECEGTAGSVNVDDWSIF